MKKNSILVFIISLAIYMFPIDINFNHLEFLRDNFKIGNKKVIGYWIYADKYGDKFIHKSAPGKELLVLTMYQELLFCIQNYINMKKRNFIIFALKKL
ncbi:hypothetical protein [Marinitoga lauensis]|uniref:hypothetical protein n=1 Tax=Marinitoga lauensis TaxID=2201189 RepID=UPI0010123FE1|nr:hypothetical protein [Marinitoga lauensis]